MSDTILAVDLGGTRFRAGVADVGDPAAVGPVGEWAAPQTLPAFMELLQLQLAEHGATRLGLGIPGLAEGSVCRWVPNLGYLDGLDLAARLPGVSIGLGNDAQLALLAEAKAGAAAGLGDAILLAIGTGIGSAVLAGGRIVAGSRGGACSFGWAVADVDDPGEDRSGWLERMASGRALDAAARRVGLDSGSALVTEARNGDDAALAALLPSMQALGAALAGAVALLDPEAIILAGGVAASVDVLKPLILPALRRQLPPHLRDIDIRPGHFGPKAGLVGAALAGAYGPNWRNGHG
ncbi:MAG: putative N-acetyl-glucosamine kinase 2, family [Devosia sp.]|uniref:ROK family protein n=1 Tax=Devosia sp. TaxID=1871048 RepID=UPI002630B846|nr:ROK family protein [Devosia sp.]MDB5542512.1 putative N-acetyl-glucosamine kinase 2, family [Devosia sp.]